MWPIVGSVLQLVHHPTDVVVVDAVEGDEVIGRRRQRGGSETPGRWRFYEFLRDPPMPPGTPMPPVDCFREIGFDTEMWPDRCRETIFFLAPDGTRYERVGHEAVAEFVRYWENQIAVAKEYVENGCNPNAHEWKRR